MRADLWRGEKRSHAEALRRRELQRFLRLRAKGRNEMLFSAPPRLGVRKRNQKRKTNRRCTLIHADKRSTKQIIFSVKAGLSASIRENPRLKNKNNQPQINTDAHR